MRLRALFRSPLLSLLLLAPPWAGAATGKVYATAGDCDGFPAVSLTTADGLCVGLVAEGLGHARGVAVIDDDVFVVDMVAWESRKGRLLKLSKGGRHAPEVVLHDLWQPNAVVRGPGRTLYVGITGQVLQVDPYAADPAKGARMIVDGLPTTGRHPVPSLAVGADGALFVNVGSSSDNCHAGGKAPDPKAACPETQENPPRGSVLRFPARAATWHANEQPPYARGLRNSMAMAVLANGRLAVAVNSRDGINHADPTLPDAELPHDLLVVLQQGGDYGWPYCYDQRVPSPEYRGFDCAAKLAPDMLLPAHAAPLGMLLYKGDKLPGLAGKLVVGYHGYRATGHRIVAVGLDKDQRPTGAPTELVTGWEQRDGSHPQGSPVGLVEMSDGSVLIAEDHSGALLRLSRNKR
ncbi:PQQ-dependent sugar dehydrogenase [Scleromatobacter humisilvae]|uniref:PQQ-dependent sugar dehydrogenase n=1 Tax=Scleromatobacter humisilvae TaxID=2897159 RepID=A0A9X1YGB8_9BURK|nr:PQQ-dependent sugar dehydrogenase [Scleromatobacter humisilvae]MCK9685197.1 PQQ-dependent sugar dehydrogenase [Scleromatobacter humisilvae]